eukprot:jgi/Mesvir1/7698/Mv11659-RA.1
MAQELLLSSSACVCGGVNVLQRSVEVKPATRAARRPVGRNASLQNHAASHTRRVSAHLESNAENEGHTRRQLIKWTSLGLLAAAWQPASVLAVLPAPAVPALATPAGYRRHVDPLDGYTFCYPDDWIMVRGSGSDVFYRNPFDADECLIVNISSPSSKKYASVVDVGTLEQAGREALDRYLLEFMSTRLGVRRPAELRGVAQRTGADDGRLYYDIELNIKSYVNSNQMAVEPSERVPFLEWDRRIFTSEGAGNGRLYEMRVQVPEKRAEAARERVRAILESFCIFDVEGFD